MAESIEVVGMEASSGRREISGRAPEL